MKKIFMSVFVTILLFSITAFASSDEFNNDIPKSVIDFANSNGVQYIKDSLNKKPEDFGINNIDDLNKLTLDEGFQINRTDIEKLKDEKNISLKEVSNPKDEWIFLVNANGLPKITLIIQLENKQLSVEGFSDRGEVFSNTLKTFQNLTLEKESAEKPIFVIHQAVSYFSSSIKGKDYNMPIISSIGGIEKDNALYTKLTDSKDTLNFLRVKQTESLKHKNDPEQLLGGSTIFIPSDPNINITPHMNYVKISIISLLSVGIIILLILYKRKIPKRT
jgi:hypothetical protein